MGLYVSTTGSDVVISDLGITIVHPTTDQSISDQFSQEDIQRSLTLTTNIRSGALVWRKTAGGSIQPATDYDPDYIEAEDLNTGLGYQGDRLVSFKDLTSSTLKLKSGTVTAGSFTGTPKKYTVVFTTAWGSSSYDIHITGTDVRNWSWESKTSAGFVINTNANQALTGNVDWTAVSPGETA